MRQPSDQIAAATAGEVLMMPVDFGNDDVLHEIASFIWGQHDAPFRVASPCC
jgi:hypothetical protein